MLSACFDGSEILSSGTFGVKFEQLAIAARASQAAQAAQASQASQAVQAAQAAQAVRNTKYKQLQHKI